MYTNVTELIENAGRTYGYRTFSVDVNSKISFRALRERAEENGRKIRSLLHNPEAGYPVAVFGEKSNSLLTMMFSAVYAGAFYVVLNPEQPGDRLDKILQVLNPQLLIVSDELEERASQLSYAGKMITFSRLKYMQTPSAQETDTPAITGDSPLYGIFTSGSTGTPKCVLISHRDVIDFIGHFASIFGFSDTDVIGNQAPFDFDVSVKDIYTALWCGASLLLIPREYFSTPPRLLDYICDHGVTSLTWAVSALCIISGLKGFTYRVPDRLRRVMFSGEVMPVRQLRTWQKYVPDAMYVNLYGPTEITCNCMYFRIPVPYMEDHALPLGVPFPGRKVVLEDESGNILTAPGSKGEICVSGESLAIGYYNDPKQTAEHFRMEQGVRTYHTGDEAQIGGDGNLYFAGRLDFQIKHMGHRIELEEIEKNVESEEGVGRCICSYDEEKGRISAFYTGTIDRRELHIKLKEKLPQYMIPNRFTHVTRFVLNKNGKIDRRRLGTLQSAEG